MGLENGYDVSEIFTKTTTLYKTGNNTDLFYQVLPKTKRFVGALSGCRVESLPYS
ncbi:hypothetical protein CHISP_3474 [Chitinispirillum alkaliphilum]|nr:hypothetical protein CHISP_3474 [Chitinispirillum alkaliphilum]